MSQFVFLSNVNLHIITLFILFLIFTNNYKISANSVYYKNDYAPQLSLSNDDESNILYKRDNLYYDSIENENQPTNYWSRMFNTAYLPTTPSYNLRRGVIRIIPYKKRTIPLELQKALYAHGIVGRRR